MTEQQEAMRVQPGEVLFDADDIAQVVAQLGRRISSDYAGRHPILINLLKGGVVFLADLIRQITIPHHIEFMGVSSYENGTRSSGNVRILEDLTRSIEGRDVIIVEDVIDTGTTLAYILNMLQLRNPRSIEVCALLRKTQVSDRTHIPVRYIGREIPDVFVVGYGLDYDENYRHLPHIARLDLPGE
jgi:hypoxanthine phosphoribosyltransferase